MIKTSVNLQSTIPGMQGHKKVLKDSEKKNIKILFG